MLNAHGDVPEMTAQQLKASILQLAIQGKLVPQNPSDEPASDLLKRIKAEKAALIKSGKLKKEKPLPPISEDEIPFDIPDSWEWVRLNSITINRDGERIPLSKDIRDSLEKKYDYYGASGIIDKVDKYIFHERLLLIGEDGANLLNRTKPIAFIANGLYWVNNHAHVLQNLSGVLLDYLCWFINAIPLSQYVTGTAQPKMNQENMNKILVPLPPLEEQKRIVAKIEELLPRVAEYGKAETELSNLNAELPEQLKKSILQWAIQGRLVPQDPTDEPASELLKRIKAEKAALIKSGKLKKEKPLPPISENEIPFDIPESWEWIRLGDVCLVARGGSPRPIKDYITEEDNGINWIKIGDTDKGGKYINSTREKIKPSGVSKSRMVHAGDFLLTNSMSFGRPYILNVDGCIHDGWLVLSGYQTVYNKDFLFYMLSSAFAYQQFSGITGGSVVKNLNSDKVADTFFPLPPLAEQNRIVERLENLFVHLNCSLIHDKGAITHGTK